MPAQFPIIGHGDPWKKSKKNEPNVIGSGDIIHAMRRRERKDAFRCELHKFLDTRFGMFAYCFIVSAAIFTFAILAVKAAGFSI